ncbi:hypothetical protein Gotur_021013, partial [Gossypium turneri]
SVEVDWEFDWWKKGNGNGKWEEATGFGTLIGGREEMGMGKLHCISGDSTLATKVVWDNELTLIFCELCVNEVNVGNRPTTHLNSKGWEWRLWKELLKESTGIGWCPSKKAVDATEEWWAEKIQLMWQMFGGIVATGENAWAPSSGVLPNGVPIGDDTPNEGFGDSNEHSNENEGIPPNEVPSNPSHETPNRRKQTLGVVH